MAAATAHDRMRDFPSESLSAVVEIIRDGDLRHNDVMLLMDIWRMSKDFPTFKVAHTLREGNRGADWLQNTVEHSNEREVMSSDFQTELLSILMVDARDVVSQRVGFLSFFLWDFIDP